MCSNYGNTVHLPIPRSKDENQFYATDFADQNLWLDISYDENESVFKSDFGHLFARIIETVIDNQTVTEFNWTKLEINSGNNVIISNDGKWKTTDSADQLNSVCVFNVPSNRSCSKCFDERFCLFTDKKQQETECLCSLEREGKYCQDKVGGYSKVSSIYYGRVSSCDIKTIQRYAFKS